MENPRAIWNEKPSSCVGDYQNARDCDVNICEKHFQIFEKHKSHRR